MSKITSKVVSGAGQWSESLEVHEGHALAISVVDKGSWSGTVALQRQFPGQSDWRTFYTVTAVGDTDYVAVPVGCKIRIGCSAFTAGSAVVELRVSSTRAT